MAFVEVGSTNREEVLLNLGAPDYVEGDNSDFTYFWRTKAGIVFSYFFELTSAPMFTMDHRLLIEFDENGIVKNYEIEQEYLDPVFERW